MALFDVLLLPKVRPVPSLQPYRIHHAYGLLGADVSAHPSLPHHCLGDLDKGALSRHRVVFIASSHNPHILHRPVEVEPPQPLRPEDLDVVVVDPVHVACARRLCHPQLLDLPQLCRRTAAVVLYPLPHVRDGVLPLGLLDGFKGYVDAPVPNGVDVDSTPSVVGPRNIRCAGTAETFEKSHLGNRTGDTWL